TLHPSWIGTPPPPEGYDYVSPCNGTADVRASIIHGDGLGGLALLSDTTGSLNETFVAGTVTPDDAELFDLSPIWSSAELRPEAWIVVDPAGVTVSTV